MKLKELLEMAPYHAKGENPPEHWKKSLDISISKSALERDYSFLSSLDINPAIDDAEILHFYMLNEGRTIHGGYFIIDEIGEERLKIVFVLTFKANNTLKAYPKDINKKLLLQVSKVNTNSQFGRIGIASFVYQSLIQKGFIILSDTVQLDGGKALWQKMSKYSQIKDYKIRIIDDETGYLKRNGKILEYDGSNISDDEIWTTEMNFDGEHTLLIMSLK